MYEIGILAYGSLIEDPGKEIYPLIISRIKNARTPFNVEFARRSVSRDGAPTLVIVQKGGRLAKGEILVLDDSVTASKAEDLLWRRETRNEETNKHSLRPEEPTPNQVVIDRINDYKRVETVLYTRIGANIDNPTPEILAKLAINSAKKKSGSIRRDGISYLISIKRQGISTPLMHEYEMQVLQFTESNSLEEAYVKTRNLVSK